MIRRFLYLHLLRVVLVVGAFHDLLIAFCAAVAPGPPTRVLGLPPLAPELAPEIVSELLSVLLLVIGLLSVAAAREPRRYSAVIAAVVGGRLLGAFVLGSAAWGSSDLQGLWLLGGTNALLASATGWFWMGWRR